MAVPKHTGSIWFRLPQFAHILLQNWATNHISSVDFAWFYIEIESPSVTQRHCWTLPEVPNMWSTMKHHRSNMLQQSHSLLHQSLNIIELSHAKKKRPLLVTCNDLSAASPPSGALRRSSKVSGRCWSKARSSSWPRIIQCITVSDGLCIHVHTIDFRYWCYLINVYWCWLLYCHFGCSNECALLSLFFGMYSDIWVMLTDSKKEQVMTKAACLWLDWRSLNKFDWRE